MPASLRSRLVVLAAIVMVAAAGLCLLDSDWETTDLCLLPLMAASGLVMGYPLQFAGDLRPDPATAYRSDPSDLPSPPPEH